MENLKFKENSFKPHIIFYAIKGEADLRPKFLLGIVLRTALWPVVKAVCFQRKGCRFDHWSGN